MFNEQSFSKGSKVANLQEEVKNGKTVNENALATACLKTKAYKEGGDFAKAVDNTLKPTAAEAPKAEKAAEQKPISPRNAEARGW